MKVCAILAHPSGSRIWRYRQDLVAREEVFDESLCPPPSLWRWFALLSASYLCWVLLGSHLALLWALGGLVLAWLGYPQGRWAHIAQKGTWNVERDQARQRIRLGTVVAALLCLAMGTITLLSLL